jgi:hypothetical protein
VEHLKGAFTLPGPGLARKHWTRLEKLARDKHSGLFRKSVNYGRNKFYSTGPWVAKLFGKMFCPKTPNDLSNQKFDQLRHNDLFATNAAQNRP